MQERKLMKKMMAKERRHKLSTDIDNIWSNEIIDTKEHMKIIKPDIHTWAKKKERASDGFQAYVK